MFMTSLMTFQVFIAAPMLVQVSDKSCWGQRTNGLELNDKRLLRAGQRHVSLKTQQNGGYRCIYLES
jgi:hypothetical protein